ARRAVHPEAGLPRDLLDVAVLFEHGVVNAARPEAGDDVRLVRHDTQDDVLDVRLALLEVVRVALEPGLLLVVPRFEDERAGAAGDLAPAPVLPHGTGV